MSSHFAKAVLAAVLMTLAIGASSKAQTPDNDGCSNATLKGDYAFTVSGSFTVPGGPTIPRLGVAMTHFDGLGGLKQVDFVVSNVPPPGVAPSDPVTGFHIEEKGTYTVYNDCTGTFTINFPDFTTPTGMMIPGAIITAKFVIANQGRSIYTVVSSLQPPGAAKPLPPTNVAITSEGHKLGIIGQEY